MHPAETVGCSLGPRGYHQMFPNVTETLTSRSTHSTPGTWDPGLQSICQLETPCAAEFRWQTQGPWPGQWGLALLFPQALYFCRGPDCWV